MHQVRRTLSSRIGTKIVLPYLLLAIVVSLATTMIAVRLTVGALQERLNNRLIEAGQVTSDELVAVEDQHLEHLRAMAFTRGVAEALADRDTPQLAALLRPFWSNARIHTLVAFDPQGRALLAWQRDPADPRGVAVQELELADLETWWIVRQIAEGRSDVYGDKFSTFHGQRFYTAAPVRREGRVLGGIMVGLPTDVLLSRLQSRSQASVTTLYDADGQAFGTTQVIVGDGVVPAVAADVMERLSAAHGDDAPHHIQSVLQLNGRDYQFAYSPLYVRRELSGTFSVALSRGFILDAWAHQRLLLVGLALAMLSGVVAVGLAVARHITRPLHDLVATARAVTRGELKRRATVRTHDELGVLGHAFNHMTERLTQLYAEVQEEGDRRRAILESIADGVVVCDAARRVVLMNPAAERLLDVHDWQRHHYRFDDLALTPVNDAGLQPSDHDASARYEVSGRVLSASRALIVSPGQDAVGEVVVLHDVTQEAALERAKTDLIALISHELRTPLTAIHGAVEMLRRGIGGDLGDLQLELVATAARQTQAMSALIEKAVLVASIEAGTLDLDVRPVELAGAVEVALEPLRSRATAAGVELHVELPDDLAPALADEPTLALALRQLVENAIAYGGGAPVAVRARQLDGEVALEVVDGGPGIPADELPFLFHRLRRSSDSPNTQRRGLGLGLVIARQLVERQGGSIGVWSAPGSGSVFTITLRQASYATQPAMV